MYSAWDGQEICFVFQKSEKYVTTVSTSEETEHSLILQYDQHVENLPVLHSDIQFNLVNAWTEQTK